MIVAKDKGFSLVPRPWLQVTPASSFTKFSRYDIEQSISSRFQQIVDRDPSRIAIKVVEGAVTYGTLNKMANQVAHAVLSESGARNEPIAVLGGNDVATIAAIMGVFKAGKIYVPLENSFSEAWAKFILQDTRARIVLIRKNRPASSQILAESRAYFIGFRVPRFRLERGKSSRRGIARCSGPNSLYLRNHRPSEGSDG